MIVFSGIAAAIFLVIAVVAIFYFAGNRGKSQQIQAQEAAARGHRQDQMSEPARTEGRGDLLARFSATAR